MTTQWGYWCAGVVGIDAMARFMSAMLGGMLVLVLPAFGVCVGVSWMMYRRWSVDLSAELADFRDGER